MCHVVLIVVDALRADHVGCYADEDLGTPNIDRLAREGVRFSNAISQASWTRPSVASLMTGLYPSQHGLVDRWKLEDGEMTAAALDTSIPTLSEVLAAGGYATAAFLGGNANLKPLFGITRGFSHFVWRPTNDGAVLVGEFERWLGGKPPERAFAYVHLMDVHDPLPATIIPSRLDRGVDPELVAAGTNELRAHYRASIRKADRHVGEVLRALEHAHRLEDAWVIVTADHGEELHEHGAMLAHGRTLYRELLHVPLVMRLPRRARASTIVDAPVQLIDLFPTVLDYLGRPPLDVTGRSLVALLRGEVVDGGPAFSELLRRDRYGQSVTTRAHQFIETYLFEEVRRVSPADLKPAVSVEVKGQAVAGGPFVATKVSFKQQGRWNVRGAVEAIDPRAGSLTAMGLSFEIDEATELVGLDKRSFALGVLEVGDRVSVNFRPASDGRRLATKVKRRKRGGKSKIAGVIERVRKLDGEMRVLTVLGIDVAVPDSTRLSALRQRKEKKDDMGDARSRVLRGEVIGVERELYDIQADPAEARNIVEERSELRREMEELLSDWAHSIASRAPAAAEDVEVDPETLEQLQLMGYVD